MTVEAEPRARRYYVIEFSVVRLTPHVYSFVVCTSSSSSLRPTATLAANRHHQSSHGGACGPPPPPSSPLPPPSTRARPMATLVAHQLHDHLPRLVRTVWTRWK